MKTANKTVHFHLVTVILVTLLINACMMLQTGDATPVTSQSPPTPIVPLHPGEFSGPPTTYYVRTDGGSAELCTGLADAPYREGEGDACAWQHPFDALPPDRVSRIQGGDTLFIAAGSYMMGYGAPGSDACDADYPWDCFMSSVPSGHDADHPTRFLGEGWDSGCINPPELWGTERALTILNLRGSSHVEIGCLEITDHAGCAEDHTGGLACKRSSFPYGLWADTGLTAEDAADVFLHDLRIHGLASAGMRAGRLQDWVVERVSIVANGWVGWEGDIEGEDSNSGTLTFRHWTVAWNGCVETFPEQKPTGCWAQTAGGYGDGVGTGETGGQWIIEDSEFMYNTSDGLDLLYVRRDPSSITLRRVTAVGNAGNQIKTNGPTLIENTLVVGNCGYFEGQPFTHHVDACRAAGNALSFYLQGGHTVILNNNTIASEGDCLVVADCDVEHSHCDGSERVLMRNTLFVGYPDFSDPSEQTCLAWAEGFDHQPFDIDYSLIHGTKSTPPCPGGHDLCEVSPGVFSADIDAFDGRLVEGSQAIGSANPQDAPVDDITGRNRDSTPDIGAYEWFGSETEVYLPLAIAKPH